MLVTSHMDHETLEDENRVLCRVPTYVVGNLYEVRSTSKTNSSEMTRHSQGSYCSSSQLTNTNLSGHNATL